MEPAKARPWYKKKRYLIPLLGLTALVALGSGGSTDIPEALPPAVQPAAAVIEARTPVQEAIKAATSSAHASARASVPAELPTTTAAPTYAPTQTASQLEPSSLSNDNYYTNVDGNEVHSPAYAPSGCAASGATAECRDGTCSFSQHRSGTCSHHGGVTNWL